MSVPSWLSDRYWVDLCLKQFAESSRRLNRTSFSEVLVAVSMFGNFGCA